MIIFLRSLILLILVGCVGQDSPEIRSDYERSESDYTAIQSCSKINLINDLFEYNNVANVFKCFQWNKKFPILYEQLASFNEQNWNNVFTIVNKYFVNNVQSKNRVLKSYKRLDDNNSLEFLDDIFVLLNSSTLYESARNIFACAEDQESEDCHKNRAHNITKEEIISLLKSLNTDKKNLRKILYVLNKQYETVLRHNGRVEASVRDLINTPGFDTLRLNIINILTNVFIKGISPKEVQFLQHALTVEENTSKRPWIYDLIHNENFKLENYTNLIEYPIFERPTYFQDLRVLGQYYKKGIVCEKYNDQGERIYIDLGKSVGTFLRNTNDLNYYEFLQKFFDLTIQMKNTHEFCPEIFDITGKTVYFVDGEPVEVIHNVNLLEFNESFNRYLKDEDKFNVFKLMTYVGLNAPEINDPLFSLTIGAHDVLLVANEFNKFVQKANSEYLDLSFDILKEMSLEEYTLTANVVMNIIKDEENLAHLKTLSKIWQGLSKEDRLTLLKISDAQFSDKNHVPSIMLYSVESFSEVVEVAETLLPELFGEGNAERTYETVKELTEKFSRKELNEDMRKFFSKDHILVIYKIMTEGLPNVGPIIPILDGLVKFRDSLRDLLTDGIKLTRLAYDLIFNNPDDEISDSYYRCMSELTPRHADFYYLIHNLPTECEQFKETSMPFRYLSYLNTVAYDFMEKSHGPGWPGPPQSFEHGSSLFDPIGLMNPTLLNTGIVNLKIADETLGPSPYPIGSGGISYALNTLGYHLFDYEVKNSNLLGPLKRVVELADGLLQDSSEVKIWRSYLLEKATQEENYKNIVPMTLTTGHYFKGLGEEIDQGLYDYFFNRDFGQPDPNLTCDNFHNFNLGNDPCPEKEKIKDIGTKFIKRMLTSLGPEKIRPIDMNIEGLMPTGIYLPLAIKDGPIPQHYVFDLKEQVYTYYDLADKDLPINKKLYPYFPDGYDSKYGTWKTQLDNWKKGKIDKVDPLYLQQVTTSERMETIMREFSFDDYNLLVQVANHSAYHRMDNIKLMLEKNKLLSLCINFLKNCGVSIDAEERRKANNGLAMYDAFVDIHTYFGHAENLQVFTASTVASSAPDVRRPWLKKNGDNETPILFKKEQLKGHNAVLLSLTAQLSFLTNVGRWVKDRLGRTREELNEYLNSYEFKIINDNYMRGYPLRGTIYAVSSIFSAAVESSPDGGQTFFEDAVDWIAGLDYQELRLFENTVGLMLFNNAHIGPTSKKVGLDHFYNPETDQRYETNTDFNLQFMLPVIIKKWHVIRNNWPRDMNLIDLIKKFNVIGNIVKARLLKKDIQFYRYLNNSFLIMNNLIWKKQKDSKAGIELLVDYLSKEDNVYKLAKLLDVVVEYTHSLTLKDGKRTGERLIELGQNLIKLGSDPRYDYNAFKDYIKLTLQDEVCDKDGTCRSNPHKDELATLLHYLNKSNNSGTKHLEVLLNTVARKDKDDIIQMLEEFLPYLNIRRP